MCSACPAACSDSAIAVAPRHPRSDLAEQLVTNRTGCLRHLIHRQLRTPQLDRIANGGIRHVRKVDHQHIHGHPPDQRHTLATDDNRRAGRRMAWVAIGITATYGADTRRPLSTPGAAIANRFTHLHITTDRKSTRLNSSHSQISYAVFSLT